MKRFLLNLLGATGRQAPGAPTPRPPRAPSGPRPSPREVLQSSGEPSVRHDLLDGFLCASHGQLEEMWFLHEGAQEKDPLFYAHLAGWYRLHGCIRDHQELFAAHLLKSEFAEHRWHARVLLQYLRPYQVARVVRYTKETLRYQTRALKQAVRFYLKRRENWPAWFDECAIRDWRSMKYLYSTLRLPPDRRTEAILFQRQPSESCRVQVARNLHRYQDDPSLQARLIREERIHFTTAVGAIRHYTPEVLAALVEVMTPQQLINNLRFLEKRGALSQDPIRTRVEERIREGVKESRVNDLKALVALSRIRPDPDLSIRLFGMMQDRVRNRGRIMAPTALLVDKSGSMEQCIEVGKLMAVMVSALSDSPLYVEAFDGASFSVRPRTPDLAGWAEAFRPIRADGMTSIGAPLHKLRNEKLEQVVLISDGEENSDPYFADQVRRYQERHQRKLRIFFVRVGNRETRLEPQLRATGADLEVVRFSGDYYSLPNLVPRLCSGSHHELVAEVLDVPLFTREDLYRLPPGFDEKTCEVL